MKIKKNEILIIGSEGSIGSALQKKLLKKKLDPVCIDFKKINKKNYFSAQLKSLNQISKLFNKIFQKYPNIKILVNCSGYIHSELSFNFLKYKISKYN